VNGDKHCYFYAQLIAVAKERDNVVYWKTNGKINNDLQLFAKTPIGCENSMPRLAEKSRVVKDYGLRNGNAELISNTCIAEGEIVAVFGETATIWAQDNVREFERITTQQNAIDSQVQMQDYPDSEMND